VQPQQGLQAIEKIFTKYNPAFPFEYQFADEEFGKKFITEVLIRKLTTFLPALPFLFVVLVWQDWRPSPLKSVFVRLESEKFGCNCTALLMLISKEFLKLVIIAFAIAVPLPGY
jgi:hypothetical protein